MTSKLFCFTVDVEISYPNAENGVYHFLTLFKEYNIKATFFFTVEALKHKPEIAEMVIKDGHEVASHGFTHYNAIQRIPTKKASAIYYLTKDDLKIEIERSYKAFIKRGYDVKGFRAPSLVITPEALALLPNYFKYDSSIQYKDLNSEKYKDIILNNKDNSFVEVPISNLKLLGLRFGSPILLRLGKLTKLLETFIGFSRPLVFYSHCYDFIPPQISSLKKSPLKKWWYHKKCGKDAETFFKEMIENMINKGYMFMPCDTLTNYFENKHDQDFVDR